jgi:hypothetical protein
MNSIHRRRVDRLARADAFASANSSDFPNTSKGGQAASDMRAAITEAEALDAARASSANALQLASVGKKDGRESLRARLRAISDTAKTIALDHPELKGGFQFKGNSMSYRTLLATARAFLSAAQPIKALFVEYEMPADTFDKLSANITSIEQHTDKGTASRGERVAASASLESVLRRGEEALERFNIAVRNKYRDDPAKLAAWEAARRLEHARRTRKSVGTPTNGVGTPTNGGSPSNS